eukprot:TRINITY_DN34924_c0_g1_i1.p1 TRINITY_DN34924_c0_g1~~TRINITY_DN34924_c0_g1_i1.p1  ORF type:complete len:305 (+),score=50.26 TRINITY_DN34924_c0_g1_i1:73-987(+)
MTDITLTAEEQVRYDRQMRLWGVDAQIRLMKSKVLLINTGGLGTEIAKNIVLGGAGELVIVDETTITESDLGSNFLISEEHVGSNRAEASLKELKSMNNLVKLTHQTTLPTDVSGFSIVLATDVDIETSLSLNKLCRNAAGGPVPFITCVSLGMMSLSFSDFGDSFDVTVENPTTKEKSTRSQQFCPLEVTLTKDWSNYKVLPSFAACMLMWSLNIDVSTPVSDALQLIESAAEKPQYNKLVPRELLPQLAESCVGTLSPVCSVMGGIIAQEALKVIQRNAMPMSNYFIYDALVESKGYVERIL